MNNLKDEYTTEMRNRERNPRITYGSRNTLRENVNGNDKTQYFPQQLLEHIDSLEGEIIWNHREPMDWKEWKEEEVKNALSKIKKQKTTRPRKDKRRNTKMV